MLTRRASARTRSASGRFVWAMGVLALVAACAVPEPRTPGEPAPVEPDDPVLAAGPVSPARQGEASDLMRRAEAAWTAGNAEEALRLAGRVVDEVPSAAVSGRALRLQARAALEVGAWELAEASADRYLAAVPAEHPRVPEMALVRAEAAVERPDDALLRLAGLPVLMEPELAARAVTLAREVVVDASSGALDDALAMTADAAATRPVLEARAAALALYAGDEARAAGLARAALDHGASGPDADLAEAVLAGELPEGYLASRAITLAAVLPLDGAPALASFSRLVLEGIEVAAATALDPDFDVTVEALDDGGDPDRTAELVAQLEAAGVGGVVGFLQELTLDIASSARTTGVPLISPTARVSTDARDAGVYSLEGPDPIGLQELARHAASRGYQRVAFIESTSPVSREEADLFQEELQGFGISTVGRFTYADGATFFEPQIRQAREVLRMEEIRALGLTEDDTLQVELLEPVALFVPVPAEDVELLAPQIIHFGLDTLGIDVMGTSGWTDPETLRRVDTRHTDGVTATAPLGGAGESEGYQRFREAYETRFQRSLVSAVPAVGYDAALVLLHALQRGARTPQQIRSTLEELGEIEGATGVFSVVDGRVVRRTRAVQIQSRSLNPIPTG